MSFSSLKRVFFVLLVVVTFCTISFIGRYEQVAAVCCGQADGWQSRGQGSIKTVDGVTVLHLTSPDTRTGARMYQTLSEPLAGKRIQLQAQVQARGVQAGAKPWNKARLLLVQYREGKPRYDVGHVAAALDGSTDWQTVDKVFTIAPDTDECRVVAQLSRSSGEFTVKGLSLYEVRETVFYGWAKLFVRGAWIVFVVCLFLPYLRKKNLLLEQLPVLLTVGAILIGTSLPAPIKNDWKQRAETTLAKVFAGDEGGGYTVAPKVKDNQRQKSIKKRPMPAEKKTGVERLDLTKAAHFMLFGLLALLLKMTSPSRPTRLLLFDLFMLACATELSQFFIDDRSPLISDIIIDMAGGLTGLGVSFFVSAP